MEKHPFFSIIIPVHNGEAYLASALDSVRAQNFPDFEVILVDDASTDGSLALARAYAGEDSRIRVVALKENVGAGEARNAGMDCAEGKYLLFLDSDDTYSPELLEQVHLSLLRHPAKAVCWGLSEDYLGADGSLKARMEICPKDKVLASAKELRLQVLPLEKKGLYGYLWNKAYLADYVRERKLRIPSQSFNEDEMFNIAFFREADSLNLLDYVGTHYNQRSTGSLTHRFLPNYYPIAMGRVGALLEQQIYWETDTGENRRELADIYLRYAASALERNCDKRMGLSHRQRRRFVKQLFHSSLYRELIPYAAPKSPGLFGVALALRFRLIFLCLLEGRVIHFLKNQKPDRFRKAAAADHQ